MTTTRDWKRALTFTVGAATGLVPEMLPAIVNANLGRAACLLSKFKAVVKRFDSVQNLGAMTVLCSDKVRRPSISVELCTNHHERLEH